MIPLTGKERAKPIMTNTSSKSKHEIKREATRAALLEAAETVFARDGYELAQVDEIAGISGRTSGAVYAQFKTKEQLFFALHEHLFETSAHKFREHTSRLNADDYNARLATLREAFVGTEDLSSPILDMEVKLHAIRHPDSSAEWRERYLHFLGDRPFTEDFGVRSAPDTSRIESRVLALSSLKGAILLTHKFLPNAFPMEEVQMILGEIFDGLFSVERGLAQDLDVPRAARRERAPNKATKS